MGNFVIKMREMCKKELVNSSILIFFRVGDDKFFIFEDFLVGRRIGILLIYKFKCLWGSGVGEVM